MYKGDIIRVTLAIAIIILFMVGIVYAGKGEPNLPPEPGAPSQVTHLKTEAGEGKILLSWDAVPGVTGYVVYERGKANLLGYEHTLLTKEPISQTSYTVDSLANDKEYTFCVAARNKEGEGVVSCVTVRAK